ncbi:MAG: hypothetical protein WC702_03975 [Patescibacteria group bacterium]|jgi:hypothetical protein
MCQDSASLLLVEAGFDRNLVNYLAARHHCCTAGDVTQLTRRDLAHRRGYGQDTWRCINRQLNRLGLPQIPDDPEIAAKVEALDHPSLIEGAREFSRAFRGLEHALNARRT